MVEEACPRYNVRVVEDFVWEAGVGPGQGSCCPGRGEGGQGSACLAAPTRTRRQLAVFTGLGGFSPLLPAS